MGKHQKIVCFDFDDTLCMSDGSPNHTMLELVHQHAAEGCKCYVVTARDRDHESVKWIKKNAPGRIRVKDFIKEHNLPIKQCHFTNHELKGRILREIGAIRHYDDRADELADAKQWGIEAILSLTPAIKENPETK